MFLVDYLKDVFKETKNVSFPTGTDLVITSINVFFIIVLTVCFVSLTDFIVSRLIRMLLGIA